MKKITSYLGNLLPGQNFLRPAATIAGAAALGQVIIVLVSPLLTRLYTPEDFGVLAIYASLLSMLVIVASLRYEVAITLPGEDCQALNLLALSFLMLLVFGLLGLFCVLIAGPQIAGLLNLPPGSAYLFLLPVSLLGAGSYQILSYWALREKAYAAIARTRLSQSMSLVVTQLLLGWLGMGFWGLLLGDVAGRAGGSGTLACIIWRRRGEMQGRVSPAGMRSVARRYWRFPVFSSSAALLNGIGAHLPPLLLGVFYGPGTAGWFALAQRVLGIPLALLGASVAQVYLAETAKLAGAAPRRLPEVFGSTVRSMAIIGLPLVCLAALLSVWLFPVVFGNAWATAGLYMRILAPMFLLQFIAGPTGGTLDVLERQDLAMARESMRVLLTSGAIVWAGLSGKPAVTAIACLSLAGSAGYLIYAVTSWLAIKKQQVNVEGE